MTTALSYDPVRVAEELQWLQDNPHFQERPASIREFLGPDYLDCEALIRDSIKEALIEIFGEKVNPNSIAQVQRAMVTGAIGIGKTTIASIIMPYMVHWILCLKDPQGYFQLLAGSRIAFMQMSTNANQAIEVIFGDIKARINHSPWFQANATMDDKYTKQIRFPGKDIWILPGDSSETTFEGYNILGGILDEMDSHKVTKDKDYAEVGYDTIHARISSRFDDRGLLVLIGQMKKATGFAARKLVEFSHDPNAYVKKMTLWESRGWKHYSDPVTGEHMSFFYDFKRRSIIPKLVADLLDGENSENLLEIPEKFRKDFENNPEKALRDLAGIPPMVSNPFIGLVDRIESCRDRWHARHPVCSPVKARPERIEFEDWFVGNRDPRKRVLHVDNAYSGDGDALGMAMGHIEEMVERDGERKPLVVFDFIARIRVGSGQVIMFSDVRQIIYHLRDDLGFKLHKVTMDGFNSTDTLQQLRKKKFLVEEISVDKSTLPYEDLREAIYEQRVEFPKYMTYYRNGDTETMEIALKELMELSESGGKVDHPQDGSKDVCDAMAGVMYSLIGDRTYRRGLGSGLATGPGAVNTGQQVQNGSDLAGVLGALQRLGRPDLLQAPQVPSGLVTRNDVPGIPQHLRPR